MLLICPLFGGCLSTLNHLANHSDVTSVHDLAYGSLPRQKVDVYKPPLTRATRATRAASSGLPVVVFLYGGSWQEGDRADYAFVGAALAHHGYVAFVPDYRVYPEARYPDFIEDAARAVAYAHAHAAQYGGDASKLVIIGHSAGAYLALMLALDPQYLSSVGLDPVRDLRAVVGIAGPYDFLPLTDPVLQRIFAPATQDPGGLPSSQPIFYVGHGSGTDTGNGNGERGVSGRIPPLLLMAGHNDTLVDPGNTSRLANAIRAHGGQVQEQMYKRATHRVIIGAFAPTLRWLSPSFHDSTAFIDRELLPSAEASK